MVITLPLVQTYLQLLDEYSKIIHFGLKLMREQRQLEKLQQYQVGEIKHQQLKLEFKQEH